MNKTCTKCKKNKPLEEYYKHTSTKDGRRPDCKSCCNIYDKSDKGKSRQAKYNKSDKGKSTKAKYDKTEKGKLARINQRHSRRSNEVKVIKDFTSKESKIVMFLQGYRCAYCGEYFDLVKPTLDHIYPVSKGGPLVIDNVQYLCQKHNGMKGIQEIDYRSDLHKYIVASLNI